MKVLQVPARLGLVAAMLLLCVPLIAVEIVLATRAPWWNLPYKTIEVWSGAIGLIVIPLSMWLAYGQSWAMILVRGFAILWCSSTALFAIFSRNYLLGIFALCLSFFWIMVLWWLKNEMGRSYFDPRMSWYQGLPKSIPGLICEVIFITSRASLKNDDDRGKKLKFRVCRFDEEGAFLFLDDRDEEQRNAQLPPIGRKAKLNFFFGEKKISCRGIPVRILDGERGIGYRFLEKNADDQKLIHDFAESLRGVGYAI